MLTNDICCSDNETCACSEDYFIQVFTEWGDITVI